MALTEAGRVLVEHADRTFGAVQEEAEGAVAAVKGTVGATATATLAALPSTLARIVAPALTSLASPHPRLSVTCQVTDQARLRELPLGTTDVVVGQRYHHLPDATPRGGDAHRLLDDPLLVVTAADRGGERPGSLREPATHNLAVPPPDTDCGQAILPACHQAGSTPSTPYVTTDIAAQLTLARAGLATALAPQMAIDPATAGIRTSLVGDHQIHRLRFVATRHADHANPTTSAVIAALRAATRQSRTTCLSWA